jgi:peptidoglycan-N-acetylglucosamine deacetylase
MLAESLGGIAIAVGGMTYAVRAPRSSLMAPSRFRGDPSRKSIALTFDDGPSETTPALLDVLAAHGIRATFFQCGANVRRIPRIARDVLAAGHEIGNHSDTHAALYLRSGRFIYSELAAAQQTFEQEVGMKPRLFRAPFGVRWFGLASAQKKLGLVGVTWSVIGLDWKLSAARIADRLLAKVGNGAIVCLHDGKGIVPRADISVTIEAVQRTIPRWIDQGFKFETVSQILCPTT